MLTEGVELYCGDCLEVLTTIESGSADMVLADPPYGTTACKWDCIIPFGEMWSELHRVCKPEGAICLFASEPFASALRMSNIGQYRYDWVWRKPRGSGFYLCKKKPLKAHELVCVFYRKQPLYIPQMRPGKPYRQKQGRVGECWGPGNGNVITKSNGERYPVSVLEYASEVGLHPTQKPVKLLEYLIRTYTSADAAVLDFCMGSGSTGVAAVKAGRKFIGIEQDERYFEIAKKRIGEVERC